MQSSREAQVQPAATGCNPILTRGGRVRQGTTLGLLAAIGVGAGLILGWDSLVTLGVASILISLAPCLVMCALGICASRMGKKSPNSAAAPREADDTAAAAPSQTAEAPVVEKPRPSIS